MERNEVVLVDINGKELMVENKGVAHSRPLLHRAFSVYLYNKNKEILVQRRALNKYHTPGLWSNACCSHPRIGENIKNSAHERLKDEVGVECDINEIFSFIYMNKFNENLYEYEYDHVFVGEYNGDIILNEDEVCDSKWMSIEEMELDLVNNPSLYTPWFIISVPKVIEYIKNVK